MKLSTLFFTCLSLTTTVAMAGNSEFENLLEKNDRYKGFVQKLSTNVSQGANSEELAKFNRALDKYVADKENGIKGTTEMLDSSTLDQSECSSCSSYLNLTKDVSKIIDKLGKGQDVSVANQAALELNTLNFLYYVIRYETSDGKIHCGKYGSVEATGKSYNGQYKFMSEEIVDLPNVESIQFMPNGGREVVYLYRGSGAQRNTMIEVHMLPDGKAKIRYFAYKPSASELELERLSRNIIKGDTIISILRPKEKEEPTGPYLDIIPSVKLRDGVVPTDVEMVKAKTSTAITEKLSLEAKAKISYNEQKTEFSLKDDSGSDWVKINATNYTSGNKEIVTIIPTSLVLDEESKLKIDANVKNETVINTDTKDTAAKSVVNAQTYTLSLTDHSNKYIEFELYQRPSTEYTKLSAKNEFNNDMIGTITTSFSADTAGDKSYSIGKKTDLGTYGKLTTSFGSTISNTNGSSRFVDVQHEVALSKTSSLAITARASDDRKVTTLFQFKARF